MITLPYLKQPFPKVVLPKRGVSLHAAAAAGFVPELEPPPQLINKRAESNEIVKIFMIYSSACMIVTLKVRVTLATLSDPNTDPLVYRRLALDPLIYTT